MKADVDLFASIRGHVFNKILNRLWRLYLAPQDDFVIHLADTVKRGAITAVVYPVTLWNRESTISKLKCLLAGKWMPRDDVVTREAQDILIRDVFGDEKDFGIELLQISIKHHSMDWKFEHATDSDRKKASAISTLAVDTMRRLNRFGSSPPLQLELATKAIDICVLAFPMAPKIPIISVKWFLNIHVEFAFNEIRKSSLDLKNDIIDYLYEILFLQQKTIIAISDYLHLAASVNAEKKGDAKLMSAEVDAILRADLAFTYLKASVEKVTSLLGAIHGIADLSNKKAHKDRLSTLDKKLPSALKATEYFQLIWDAISSENLDELNTYRSGLLHKKGIADLQPHNYVDVAATDLPFLKIFSVLHHNHTVNTIVLIAVLATLTDELVRKDPEFRTTEYTDWLANQMSEMMGKYYAAPDDSDDENQTSVDERV